MLGSVGGSSCSPRVPEMLVSETERYLDSGTSDTTDSAGEKREIQRSMASRGMEWRRTMAGEAEQVEQEPFQH